MYDSIKTYILVMMSYLYSFYSQYQALKIGAAIPFRLHNSLFIPVFMNGEIQRIVVPYNFTNISVGASYSAFMGGQEISLGKCFGVPLLVEAKDIGANKISMMRDGKEYTGDTIAEE
jgi:hypothetical protein